MEGLRNWVAERGRSAPGFVKSPSSAPGSDRVIDPSKTCEISTSVQ